jgi:hypothetical protein
VGGRRHGHTRDASCCVAHDPNFDGLCSASGLCSSFLHGLYRAVPSAHACTWTVCVHTCCMPLCTDAGGHCRPGGLLAGPRGRSRGRGRRRGAHGSGLCAAGAAPPRLALRAHWLGCMLHVMRGTCAAAHDPRPKAEGERLGRVPQVLISLAAAGRFSLTVKLIGAASKQTLDSLFKQLEQAMQVRQLCVWLLPLRAQRCQERVTGEGGGPQRAGRQAQSGPPRCVTRPAGLCCARRRQKQQQLRLTGRERRPRRRRARRQAWTRRAPRRWAAARRSSSCGRLMASKADGRCMKVLDGGGGTGFAGEPGGREREQQ